MGEKKFIGTLPQKELLKLYAKHVNGPKVKLFKGFGFNVIPGAREGIKFKTLERVKEVRAYINSIGGFRNNKL